MISFPALIITIWTDDSINMIDDVYIDIIHWWRNFWLVFRTIKMWCRACKKGSIMSCLLTLAPTILPILCAPINLFQGPTNYSSGKVARTASMEHGYLVQPCQLNQAPPAKKLHKIVCNSPAWNAVDWKHKTMYISTTLHLK